MLELVSTMGGYQWMDCEVSEHRDKAANYAAAKLFVVVILTHDLE
jgi:hypothetical protein